MYKRQDDGRAGPDGVGEASHAGLGDAVGEAEVLDALAVVVAEHVAPLDEQHFEAVPGGFADFALDRVLQRAGVVGGDREQRVDGASGAADHPL